MTWQVAGPSSGEQGALHPQPMAEASTGRGVHEPKRCFPKACSRGRRLLALSGAATAFISIQVLRSWEFDVSAAINLMKPRK